jgi:hypothetical protein
VQLHPENVQPGVPRLQYVRAPPPDFRKST